MSDKSDRRVSGGLNNKGYPLRKIVGLTDDGKHILSCNHALPPVGTNHVRSRRCPECAGKSFDVLEPIKTFAQKIQNEKKVTEFDSGEINIERETPNGGKIKLQILNIQISYEEIED